MRACYVLLRYPVLSETFVRDEIAALEEAGNEVFTVSVEGGPGADVALATHRSRSTWVTRRALALALRRPLGCARALARPGLSLGLRWKLLAAAEEARRRGVDTVHAHFAYRNADAAEVIGTALGLGYSVTVHARDVFVPSGDVGRRLRRARVVVTVCNYNEEFLRRHYPELSGKVVVIACSTRIRELTPWTESPRRAEGEPLVLSIGRLVEKKGFDDLLRALALMSAGRLVVIGSGPLDSELRRLAEELGVSGRVQWEGEMEHDDALGWLAGADVFCLPCKVASDGDRDSMPVVIKEAMAAGLPVVSTREVGVPEMVDDGTTGLLVPPSDPPALAAALQELLRDPARRRAMGAAGAVLVAERFDLVDQARKVTAAIGPGGGDRLSAS